MNTITLKKATELTGKSESTIRRDVKKGKVSAARDDRGHIHFDAAELVRVYGELKSSGDDDKATQQSNGQALTGHDSAEIIALKDTIADLRTQLGKAEQREAKLFDLASRLQLMIPGETEKKPNWVQRLLTTSRAQSEKR